MLLHGWTEALRYWVYVIRELTDQFRIVAYDLRGHGRSGRAPGDDYSLARFGDDLEAVLEATVPADEQAVVAGHSLGGMSIAAWAGRKVLEETARIDEVARRLGMASLDRAARFIEWDWHDCELEVE